MPQTTNSKKSIEKMLSLSNSKDNFEMKEIEVQKNQNDIQKQSSVNTNKIEVCLVNCDICHEELSKDDQVSFECGHNYHSECIRKNIVEQIDDDSFPVMCPLDNCEQEPSMFLLSVLISREKFQACLDFETSLCPLINENNCYNCGQRFFSDSEVDLHKCLKCKAVNCLSCHQGYHPNQPCKKVAKQNNQSTASNLQKVTEQSEKTPANTTHFDQRKNLSTIMNQSEQAQMKEISQRIQFEGRKILPDLGNSEKRRQSHQPKTILNAPIAQLFSKAYKSSILNPNTNNYSALSSNRGQNNIILSNAQNSSAVATNQLNASYIIKNHISVNSQYGSQNSSTRKPSLEHRQSSNNSMAKQTQLLNTSQVVVQNSQLQNSASKIQKSSNNDILSSSLYQPEGTKFKRLSLGKIQLQNKNHRKHSPLPLQEIAARF
ncbi:zinc finger, C3HC4 type (RING finger) protein (macronuclear) [Tetrahymena thermophila SB210]|uniref:Zinc finger, C3HC4 type (RING finger) protein n=1 Tax=Tetrahymena thermophila (strain SB210) TaxID=312017 RepID=I7LZS4_TETTS|nr:zinc finger, C3HC4 type (RING finger) protein [Tetrahymena thermophila SB210]EAR84824.3 zinc finger, C3HC4 type (RING finger) protein [Tetrahymena thermophila SB210]|eukprot:XP_001032487.3 zinc finger, C3HC4 type (RING finger) protein [Tetrahymena thermophila SB210]